jgi:hypothetical protein
VRPSWVFHSSCSHSAMRKAAGRGFLSPREGPVSASCVLLDPFQPASLFLPRSGRPNRNTTCRGSSRSPCWCSAPRWRLRNMNGVGGRASSTQRGGPSPRGGPITRQPPPAASPRGGGGTRGGRPRSRAPRRPCAHFLTTPLLPPACCWRTRSPSTLPGRASPRPPADAPPPRSPAPPHTPQARWPRPRALAPARSGTSATPRRACRPSACARRRRRRAGCRASRRRS